MKASARLYDVVRIDHFIGVTQYYAIPAGSEDGKTGEWLKGPGKKLTDAINMVIGDTKIIAGGSWNLCSRGQRSFLRRQDIRE